MTKHALLTDQDGAYLAQSLLKKGCQVCGLIARCGIDALGRLCELNIVDQLTLLDGDPIDLSSMICAMDKVPGHRSL